MKTCNNCGVEISGLKTKFCSKKCQGQHQHIHTDKQEKKENKAFCRKIAFVLQKGGCCEKCGYDRNTAALTFHHINPEEKLFELDTTTFRSWPIEKLQKEVDKCQLLCCNCHTRIHSQSMETVVI